MKQWHRFPTFKQRCEWVELQFLAAAAFNAHVERTPSSAAVEVAVVLDLAVSLDLACCSWFCVERTLLSAALDLAVALVFEFAFVPVAVSEDDSHPNRAP